MVVPSAGSVVLVPFPFSDLSQSKLRPAVVLADAGHGDWILCQLTSSSYSDARAVKLENADFKRGSLRVVSYARPGKLFTANQELLVSQVAHAVVAGLHGMRVRIKSTLRLGSLTLWDGRPLPAELKAELEREVERLRLVERQIAAPESERRERLREPKTEAESERDQGISKAGNRADTDRRW